jgi:hypothetical protein
LLAFEKIEKLKNYKKLFTEKRTFTVELHPKSPNAKLKSAWANFTNNPDNSGVKIIIKNITNDATVTNS